MLTPAIKTYQRERQPRGMAFSQSKYLLKNTFNQDIYNEFLKARQQVRDEFKFDYSRRDRKIKKVL